MKSPWETTEQQLNEGLVADFHRQAQGIVRLYLIDNETAIKCLVKSLSGDTETSSIVTALDQAIKSMTQSKRAALCLFCDHRFKRGTAAPAAFVVYMPTANPDADPGVSVVSAVCERCFKSKSPEKLLAEAGHQMDPNGEVVTP